MKTNKKRVLCWLLTICMVVWMLPTTVLALEQPQGDSGVQSPVTEPVTPPPAEEPPAEPAIDPPADPATEPVTDPAAEPVPDPAPVPEIPEAPPIDPDTAPAMEPVLFQTAGFEDILFMSASLEDTKFTSFTLTPQEGGSITRAGVIVDDTITVDLGKNEKSQLSLITFTTSTSAAIVTYDDDGVKVATSGVTTLSFENPRTFTVSYGGAQTVYTVTVTENGNAVQDYGIGVKTAPGAHYNVGEEVTYEVYATAPTADAMAIGSFQFTMDYAEAQLTFDSFTPDVTGLYETTTSAVNGTVEIAYTAGNGEGESAPGGKIPLVESQGKGYAKLGDITYTVKNDIPEKTNALIDASISSGGGIVLEITPDGYDENTGTISLESDTDNAFLHNNIATFQNNNTTGITEGTKAYLKYGEVGMWTDNSYDVAFTVPTPVAADGYRVPDGINEDRWTVSGAAISALNTSYLTAELGTTSFINANNDNNITVTPISYWQVAVTYVSADTTKGAVTTAAGMTLTNTYDEGMKLGGDPDYTMPTPAPEPGYEFLGWTLDPAAQPIAYIDLETYTVPGATQPAYTVYAMFGDADYTFSIEDKDTNHVTEAIISGVSGSSITHGTDITFTLSQTDTEADEYHITAVEYKVGDDEWTTVPLTAGTYTIPGTAIVGDVTLRITTNHYHTLTYAQGEGVLDTGFNYTKTGTAGTLTAAALYVKHNIAGLYEDKACTVPVTPQYHAVDTTETNGERYRAPDDKANPIWTDTASINYYIDSDHDTEYSKDIGDATFDKDSTLTSKAVKQYQLTFTAGYKAANGDAVSTGGISKGVLLSNADETNKHTLHEWYDAGYSFKGFPVATVADGYTTSRAGFDNLGWNPSSGVAANAPATYTYVVTDGEYSITLTDTAVTYTTTSGVSVNDTVVHGTDVTFKVTEKTNDGDAGSSYKLTDIKYSINGVDKGALTADQNGVYTIDGDDIIGAVVITPVYTQYVTVTFVAGTGTTYNGLQTVYAKYNEAGLYTTTDFTTAAVISDAVAKENYRLYDTSATKDYWTTGGATPAYVSAATIANTALTGNTTYTATAVKTVTINFNAPVNGKLNGGTSAPASITFDLGTTLGALTNPAFPTAAANTGYAYTGWTHDNGPATASDDVTIEAANIAATNLAWLENGSYTFTANFDVLNFKWYVPEFTNAGYDTSYGDDGVDGLDLSGGFIDDTIDYYKDATTYGTNITFKLTPAAGQYAIRIDGVRYSVGGVDKGTLTPVAGVYTIDGNELLGDVRIFVTGTAYVTVNFQGGIGNTIPQVGDPLSDQDTEAFAVSGIAGLYATLDDLINSPTTTFAVPTPAAINGYRLMADNNTEPLWSPDPTTLGNLTSTGARDAIYGENTTLTARSQKTWQVTFTNDDTFAAFDGTITHTIDDGKTVGSAMPTITYDPGNVFDKWTVKVNNVSAADLPAQNDPASYTITGDTNFDLVTKDGEYNITFNGGSVATFTPGAGIVTGKVTHDTDASFTVTNLDGKRVTGVSYTIGSTTVPFDPAGGTGNYNGTYTISGANIIGDISVAVTSIDTYVVTFKAGANGSFTNVEYVIDKDGSVSQTQLAAANTAAQAANAHAPGWAFSHWTLGVDGATVSDNDITNATVTGAVTYIAVYVSPDRLITDTNSIIGSSTGTTTSEGKLYGKYGTDVVITPVTTKTITGLSYKVQNPDTGVWGDAITVTVNPDGTYTIPGTAITGPIEIIGTVLTATGDGDLTMEFIQRSEYKAITDETENRKILVLNGAIAGDTYKLADGTLLYWSSKYNAAVCWVDDDETAATLAPGMVKTNSAAPVILYTGNINLDPNGDVTAADAGIISDCLHGQRLVHTSYMQLFMLDVEGTGTGVYKDDGSGWKYVSAADITWTLKKAIE